MKDKEKNLKKDYLCTCVQCSQDRDPKYDWSAGERMETWGT